jgi:hypothetical protein
MTDPTGTAGAVKESDLMLATQGGPRFMTRLQQLGDATDKHEQAFAQLEIGQSAVAAFNQAQHKLAEAEHKLAEAEALRRQAAKTKPKPTPELTPKPTPSKPTRSSRCRDRSTSTSSRLKPVSKQPLRPSLRLNVHKQMRPDCARTYRVEPTLCSPVCAKSLPPEPQGAINDRPR